MSTDLLPDAWQWVPAVPTSAMYCAGDESIIEALNDHGGVRRDPTPAQGCYRDMLAAAPIAPPESSMVAAIDASWRATLHIERNCRLAEIRLKDEYRTRAITAEAELEASRKLLAEIAGILMPPDELSNTWTGSLADAVRDTITRLTTERDTLLAKINTPLTDDWFEGVRLEAAHQIVRYGAAHDAGKNPFDWVWTLGYLGQKASMAALLGDVEKAKHHTISTGALLLNWFRHITGESTEMRPGIDPVERGVD